ncbi:MAG: two-component system, chemotaxis family, CheB/CheR fusion protein [Fimbriimonadaceae bacterium]|nr:two-component system, chemotaxis family, CheB/CheR fusion protein [Fimbriimonadaceae bacterium]
MGTTLPKEAEAPQDREGFDRLLAFLKHTRGFDFSSYKRTTLSRRIMKRLEALHCNTFSEYTEYLEVHPDEFPNLFNTILINVTAFYRDAEAWQFLADEVIPRVVKSKGPEQHIRAWVAGCASGEEACTLAMVLAETIGRESFCDRVKLYATDLDDDALNHSRAASYSAKDVENLPAAIIEKYFELAQDRYLFDRELRRCIIFGKHDLLQDAPISRVDLLFCRNTLMYFNAEAQDRILNRFHFALNDDGFLFLGKAETLLSHGNSFTPADLKSRVFSKVPRGRGRTRDFVTSPGAGDGTGRNPDGQARLRDASFEIGPIPQIVIDNTGRLFLVNERARALLGLTHDDLGRPIQDLEVSYKPIELRSGIEQAQTLRRPVIHKDVPWTNSRGENLVVDLSIAPVLKLGGEVLGTSIAIENVTQVKRLQDELLHFNQELETAYEEVQSTNEELQTTNEELQSTVEELETTNEELQSTNEELETMNEELQSTNEELETINDEIQQRGDDLNQANAFMQSVLGGLRDGVIVVDREVEVIAWNYRSEDLWGLRGEEVIGKHLFNVDIGLPVEQLRNSLRKVMASGKQESVSFEATNRRGKQITCNATLTPLQTDSQVRGVIILVEDLSNSPTTSE